MEASSCVAEPSTCYLQGSLITLAVYTKSKAIPRLLRTWPDVDQQLHSWLIVYNRPSRTAMLPSSALFISRATTESLIFKISRLCDLLTFAADDANERRHIYQCHTYIVLNVDPEANHYSILAQFAPYIRRVSANPACATRPLAMILVTNSRTYKTINTLMPMLILFLANQWTASDITSPPNR